MAVLTLEVWVEPSGSNSLIFAGELGAEARKLLAPGAKMIHVIRAGSHFEAMTVYNEFLGREPYATPYPDDDMKPYRDAWVAMNR